MKNFTVAICIPTYNQAEYLKASIDSALDQTYSNVSVYVSDDKSTDDTENICKNYKQQHPNFYYTQNKVNLGIAKNVDKLLRWPQTDFIVRLDSDDLLDPEYVTSLLHLFEKYPKAGIGHVNVQQIDEYGKFTRKRILARTKEFYSAERSLKESVYGYKVAANICMFKRAVLEKLDFTSGRPEYTEDYDLWVRIADAGWGNVFSSKILAFYRVWVDKNNYRVSIQRKEAELIGYSRLFTECIEPAFNMRNWNKKIIEVQREQFALEHAVALKNTYFTDLEKQKIEKRVLSIYNSKKVRSRISTYVNTSSYKARFFSFRRILVVKIKDVIKTTHLRMRNFMTAQISD